MKYNILEPDISSKEKSYVNNALNTNLISSVGDYSKKFENKFKEIKKFKYNIALNSGTSALQLALVSSGIKKNDLVIMPSYTFAATANTVIYNNSIPWFFDIDKNNYCLDLKKVEEALIKNTKKRGKELYHKQNNKRIFGILAVFSFGLSPDLDHLKKIQNKYNIKIILDAASGHFTEVNKKFLSYYNFDTCFSFNGNKSMTSGGGGIFSTNNKKKYLKVKILSNVGKSNKYKYSEIGFNYKITNLHAAIGLGQLEKYNLLKEKKYKINKFYYKRIENKIFEKKYLNQSELKSLWIYFIILKNEKKLKKFLNFLNKNKINASQFWYPLHFQKPYKKFPTYKLNFSKLLFKKLIILPSSTFLKTQDLKFITKTINRFF